MPSPRPLAVWSSTSAAAPRARRRRFTLAEATLISVVCTLMGKGVLLESHELFVGWPGVHGVKAANSAMDRADPLVAAGARFDARVTGWLDDFAPMASLVHIDVDPREMRKIRKPDVPVVGELDAVLVATLSCGRPFAGAEARTVEWDRTIEAWHRRFSAPPPRLGGGSSAAAERAIARLAEAAAGTPEVVWTTGVGQHRPRSFITSRGHGTMGFGLPAAIGAKVARTEATAVCVDGDGSVQTTAQQLVTLVPAELPVVVVIINNQRLGMVHQWQAMLHEGAA